MNNDKLIQFEAFSEQDLGVVVGGYGKSFLSGEVHGSVSHSKDGGTRAEAGVSRTSRDGKTTVSGSAHTDGHSYGGTVTGSFRW